VPFALAPAYERLLAEARAVAAAAEPLAVEADAGSSVHEGMLALLRESGLTRHTVAAAYGGHSEVVDPLAICVIREALMAVSSHLDSLFALQGVGSYAISRGADDEQKSRWLPRVAVGEVLAALALTEPDAGSDLKSIQTTLTVEGDVLRVSGQKSFISNAGAAAFYTTLVREGDGYSLVLVPGDAPGVHITPLPELIAPHVIGDMTLDAVELGASARIGPAGAGFDLVLATLSVFRVSVAGAAVGLAAAALEEGERHARQRVQFGRPLARLGAVAGMLADSWTDVEMARLITYRAAERAQLDPLAALPHSSMAKLAATEAAGRVVDRSVQIMGRFGLVRDSKIERLYRQARPMRVYEGSSEVLRVGIAKALAQEFE
jgi:acyl-CoA dehydrogenase